MAANTNHINHSQVHPRIPLVTSNMPVFATYGMPAPAPLAQQPFDPVAVVPHVNVDLDSDAMDVDDDDVEHFFPGHFPLPGDRYHGRTLDQDTIEQQLVPDITFGIAAIDLDPFDHRQPAVVQQTAPPVLKFPNDARFTTYQASNATTVAPFQTANTTETQGNVFTQEIPQQNLGSMPGAWTVRPGFQGVGYTPEHSTSAETGQTASTSTSGGSGPSTAQVQRGLRVDSSVTRQPSTGHLSAQAVSLPVTAGNDASLNNGFHGAIADGGDIPPVILLQGSADLFSNSRWAVLVWPRSVIDQAARLMASTEQRIRQTALQLATVTAQDRGVVIGESRATEAFEAAKAEITVTAWSEGYVIGHRNAQDDEETAIAEVFEEGRAREREVLEQSMARRETNAYDRGVETIRRSAQLELDQRQRTIAGLEDRLSRATQNSSTAQRQAENVIEQQRARIQQLENDAATTNTQAEQRLLEHAELDLARQQSEAQEQVITRLRREANNARSAHTEQSNRNEDLEQQRASLEAQVAALRQERDGYAAELAMERAETQVAQQAAPARIQVPDQDANMDQADNQGAPANAAGVLDDAILQDALLYQGDVFDRNSAQIIQSMHITVRQVLGEGGGVLENEDIFVLGQRPEFAHPIIGADRIRSLITEIGRERVRDAVSEVGFQDDVLAQLMGGATVAPAVTRPQHALLASQGPGGVALLQSQATGSTNVPGSFYDELENGAGPVQGQAEEMAPDVQGATLLDLPVVTAPAANPPVAPLTAATTSGFSLDPAKLQSLVREASTLLSAAAPRRRRRRATPPGRDSAAFDMSSLTAGLPNSTWLGEPPRPRSPSPLQEITTAESVWANAPAPILSLVHRAPAQGRGARQQARTRSVLDNVIGSSRDISRRGARPQ
ncbi:hypothetical protein QFC20_002325 [Naganishia adeliensis]|uniref:Uncharacterized protein n=1 Tax=Naganishia adeliensis TaxID=92952 RepID=A0ACC2WLP5_9TREE|nr:hypothetical protein QFC20_002325 [Naganishia adeliensis]